MKSALQQALNLSLPDRIQLVQDLWDSISDEVLGTVTRADILQAEQQLLEYEKDPTTAVSWESTAVKLGLKSDLNLL